ncbi:hypothetical protein CRUP_018795 [Coryphaenoides rupestris]|nr:hypothetical protein CRUP_018795 [Coryphaenoides rupestris]
MSPRLLDMKTPEVCEHCRAAGLLDDEDVENYLVLISFLQDTEHYFLHNDLSGCLTNDNTDLYNDESSVNSVLQDDSDCSINLSSL